MDSGVYLFASITNTKFDIELSSSGYVESVKESESAFGAGAGYHFTSSTAAEISYEDYDGLSALNFGLKFRF